MLGFQPDLSVANPASFSLPGAGREENGRTRTERTSPPSYLALISVTVSQGWGGRGSESVEASAVTGSRGSGAPGCHQRQRGWETHLGYQEWQSWGSPPASQALGVPHPGRSQLGNLLPFPSSFLLFFWCVRQLITYFSLLN